MPRQRLEKRKDGRFVCRYDDKYFYGKTQAEATRKRDAYISELESGYSPESETTTFAEYSQTWLETYRGDCIKRSKDQYESFIKYCIDHLRKKRMRDITATDIQKLYNSLTGYSESYIHKFATTVRGIFKAAMEDGVVIRNPTLTPTPPKGASGEHRNIELWERKLVVDTCQNHRFGLAAMVMLYAGLRRGEALFLDIDRDVDFEKKTLTVRGAVSFGEGNQPVASDGKTEYAQRTIPLNDILADALKGHHGLLVARESGQLMS